MTFIEVLIALFIIVTGVLGAVAMQAIAKKASFDAMQRSIASSLAEDIIARMRTANTDNLAAYVADDYGTGTYNGNQAYSVGKRCSSLNECSEAEMVSANQYEWEHALMGWDVTLSDKLAGGLIGARGCISQADNVITVTVSWQGRQKLTDNARIEDCGTAGNKRRQVVVQAYII